MDWAMAAAWWRASIGGSRRSRCHRSRGGMTMIVRHGMAGVRVRVSLPLLRVVRCGVPGRGMAVVRRGMAAVVRCRVPVAVRCGVPGRRVAVVRRGMAAVVRCRVPVAVRCGVPRRRVAAVVWGTAVVRCGMVGLLDLIDLVQSVQHVGAVVVASGMSGIGMPAVVGVECLLPVAESVMQLVEHLRGGAGLRLWVIVKPVWNMVRAVIKLPDAMAVSVIAHNVMQPGFPAAHREQHVVRKAELFLDMADERPLLRGSMKVRCDGHR